VGYIEETLTPGEQVLHRTRLHWIVLIWPFVFGIVFLAAAVACLIGWYSGRNDPDATVGRTALLALVVAEVLVAAIAFGAGLVRRAGIEMAVTNRRLIVKTGVVRRHTIELMLSKIESISVSQGVLGRIANYGDVLVRGSGGTAEHFPRIADPLRLRFKAQEQIERSHGVAGPSPTTVAMASSSTPGDYAPPGSQPAQRFCGQCGTSLPPEVEFCPRCGARRHR
jgi:membrane protein YdbS with pleckstrin-like domain